MTAHPSTTRSGAGDLLAIGAADVAALLDDREALISKRVAMTYLAHAEGRSALPHSTFLRFPNRERDRIIALPAYLDAVDAEGEAAGLKWIASFPGNADRNLPRASALIVLNDMSDGRPIAILEGSAISIERTAASAALAAALAPRSHWHSIALIGCGLINAAVARYLLKLDRGISRVCLYDPRPEAVRRLSSRISAWHPEIECRAEHSIDVTLRDQAVVSIATTAVTPHVSDLADCAPGTFVLHLSLRDLTPEAVLQASNMVDDVDHALRENTSLHLAEMKFGHRNFVHCTLAEVLRGDVKVSPDAVTVFSPFGLGVLDLDLARWVHRLALETGRGSLLRSFLP